MILKENLVIQKLPEGIGTQHYFSWETGTIRAISQQWIFSFWPSSSWL